LSPTASCIWRRCGAELASAHVESQFTNSPYYFWKGNSVIGPKLRRLKNLHFAE
jgi:hypothetical protein